MEQDSPKTARRREREKRTISQMIAMHCAGTHEDAARTHRAFCDEAVCAVCAELDAYAVLRTERCRNMDVKTSCEECGNHCYAPKMRELIRAAMRYSGPRMLAKHPIAAVRHLLGK
ncbi:MAG: nitrous oxide-stimulated promoter family protein [Eggerthellaceae bacterium]|nr:nitrous oxide-stimulated promoter family protein [Eggerthellaceae bacterium]